MSVAPSTSMPQVEPANAGQSRAAREHGKTGAAATIVDAPLALNPTALIVIAMIGVAFVALFHHFFYVQNFQAMTSADWSHSYFIPFVTLYLLWHRRAELVRIRPEVFWPGLIPMVLGIACYVLFQLGRAFDSHMLRGFSMLLCLFGIVLLLLGPRVARAMLLPIAFLVFGVTLAEKIMREFTVPLRLIATEGSFALLSFMGVSANRTGNILEIQTGPNTVQQLNIADVCAGMRMVIAFVALGAAVALIGAKYWWQRIFLLLLAVPVAVVMNIFRVASLGLLTFWDPKLAQGESHMIVGYLLLVPAFLFYMGLVWALDRIIVDPKPAASADAAASAAKQWWWRPEPIRWRALAAPSVLVCMGVLSATALALPITIKSLGVHLRKLPIYAEGDRQLRTIPNETESWKQLGQDLVESSEAVAELGTQNYLTRQYAPKVGSRADAERPRGGSGGIIQLHVAYYTGMIDAIPHVPERCMVAGGWIINEGGTRTIPLTLDRSSWSPHEDPAAAGEGYQQAKRSNYFSAAPGQRVTLPLDVENLAMRITQFSDPSGQQKYFAGYFFIANGGVAASAEEVRVKAFDYRNDYAFYCKVQMSGSFESAEDLAARASSLMSELLPEIMSCVPDWRKVQTGAYPPDNPRRPGAPKS
ncbi:MAG: exosortase/archaeosortase family protein [Phycisphaerales bacterium]